MSGYHSQQTILRPDENTGHRTERHKSAKSESAKAKSRRPQPSVKWIEHPSAIVIRQPAPRLRTDKRPAKHRVHEPASARKRRPAQSHAVRPPTISVSSDRIPRSVRVKVRDPRSVVRRAHILLRCARRRRHGILATRNPAVEIIIVWKPRDFRGLLIARAHRK